MIDKISTQAMVPVGAVIVFFIMQGWASGNIRRPQYFAETPPAGSPEEQRNAIPEREYNAGAGAGGGKRISKGATIPYDVKAGTCPVGYQKEWANYGDISVPVCREIITN